MILLFVKGLFRSNRSLYFFGCAASVAHLFYILIGGYMNKNIQNKEMDITNVELTPGEPTVCLENGEQGFECCCDECNYYLLCFPEFDPKNRKSCANK